MPERNPQRIILALVEAVANGGLLISTARMATNIEGIETTGNSPLSTGALLRVTSEAGIPIPLTLAVIIVASSAGIIHGINRLHTER